MITKAQLMEFIAERLSTYAIAERLDCGQTTVRWWLDKYGLKTNPLRGTPATRTWTDADLQNAVASSTTKAEVLRKLGLTVRGGNYRTLVKHLERLQLDVSHFTGRAHGKSGRRSDREVFVEDATYKPSNLYKRLVQRGWPEVCAICGLDSWQGKPIRLQVDHINGKRLDHRLNNLRFLCPNCHSQTHTWGSRNTSG